MVRSKSFTRAIPLILASCVLLIGFSVPSHAAHASRGVQHEQMDGCASAPCETRLVDPCAYHCLRGSVDARTVVRAVPSFFPPTTLPVWRFALTHHVPSQEYFSEFSYRPSHTFVVTTEKRE